MVNRVVEDLRENGRVTRAWLGVWIQAVDNDLAKAFGLEKAMGALVDDIVEDGPAEKAGLKKRDIILEFDGQEITSSNMLPTIVSTRRPGEKKKVKVIRAGKIKTVNVTLGEMPEETAAAGPVEDERSDIGFTVETARDDRLRYYGYSRDTEGVIITSVDRMSAAYKKNLRAGQIIQEMGPDVRNLKKIETKRDFDKQLSRFEPGDIVLLLVRRDNENTFFVALNIPK